MELKLSGKYQKSIETTGVSKSGKDWNKTDIVILDGDKPYVFGTWGETTKTVKQLKQGEYLNIVFEVECREYNGKYFTNLTAKNIEVLPL